MICAEDETSRIAAVLAEYGRNRNLKIRCTVCGAKMDMTDLYPFEVIKCPGCHSDICRPAFFGNYLLKENLPPQDPLTSIYLARDLKLERDILIRILNPSLSENRELTYLYLKTARTLAVFNHPSAVPIYNCGEIMGLFFIAARKPDGSSLETLMNEYGDRPFPESRVVAWMSQIISALKKAEELKICHGNLSPCHLLQDGEDRILISGFGIGELSAVSGISLSAPCSAPERDLTVQRDLCNAGMIFFRLLAGRFPEPGERELPKKIKLENPPISGLIRFMLEPDPLLRITPANALVILEQIENKIKSKGKRKKTEEGSLKRKYVLVLVILVFLLLSGAAAGFFFLFPMNR